MVGHINPKTPQNTENRLQNFHKSPLSRNLKAETVGLDSVGNQRTGWSEAVQIKSQPISVKCYIILCSIFNHMTIIAKGAYFFMHPHF